MEKQINLNELTPLVSEVNPVSQSIKTPEKSKTNHWVVFVIVLALIIVLGSLTLNYLNNNKHMNPFDQIPTPSGSASIVPVSLETINLKPQFIGDSTTELFFSENNIVYSIKNDGKINKVVTLEDNIINLIFPPEKKDLIIYTERPELIKEEFDKRTNKMIPLINPNTAYWILKEGAQEATPLFYNLNKTFSPYAMIDEMTHFEKIYTKENQSGGADILLDNLDGSTPLKIGLLKEKPLERQTCETGGNCLEKFYPNQFVSSFDGSFLFSVPSGGGGLGTPAIVVSRDGSKIYKIDFYWYVSSAAWINNNKLLTQDQKGAKIFTFNIDGTFGITVITTNIGDYFAQRTLSSDHKLIGVVTYNPNYEISLFDINTYEKRIVETISPENLDDPNAIRIVGWSKDSKRMFYVVGDSAKVYDIKSNKIDVLVSFKNGAPDWVSTNKQSFLQDIFEIR